MSDRLSEIEARLAAATPGPWEADTYPVRKRSSKTGRVLAYRPEDGTRGSVSVVPSDGVYGVMDGPDAELIAHAPADLAALVKFAREVERLHKPHPDGGQGYDSAGEYVWFDQVCQTCGQHDEYGVPWPCPTAQAVQGFGGAS